MKKINILLMSVIAMGFALHSCAPDPIYSYPPEYQTPLVFTLDDPAMVTLQNQSNVSRTKSCAKAARVTAFLPTTYAGAYITTATYSWKMQDKTTADTIYIEKFEQLAPHKHNCPPKWTFTAPDSAGTYVVHFRAWYDYSAQTENGALFGGYPTSSNYEGASTIKAELRVY